MNLSKGLLLLVGVSASEISGERFAEIRIRYISLALVVIAVALVAGGSMGYAVSTISQSSWAGVVGGAIWCTIILTVESFLIVSLKPRLSIFLFLAILARLTMAVLIAQLVAVPIELRIFKPEIENKLSKLAADEYSQSKRDINQQHRDAGLTELNEQKRELENRLDAINADCKRKQKAYDDEVKGKPGDDLSGKVGEGRWAKIAKEELDRCEKEQTRELNESNPNSIASRLRAINGQLKQAEDNRDRYITDREKTIAANTGLLAQINALNLLTKEDAELKHKVLLLQLFIMVIETLPICGKLFLLFGEFERLRVDKETVAIESERKNLLAAESKEDLNFQYEAKSHLVEMEKKLLVVTTGLIEKQQEEKFKRVSITTAYALAEQSNEFHVNSQQSAREIAGSLWRIPNNRREPEPAAVGQPPLNGKAPTGRNGKDND